jgi:hypothetical protein
MALACSSSRLGGRATSCKPYGRSRRLRRHWHVCTIYARNRFLFEAQELPHASLQVGDKLELAVSDARSVHITGVLRSTPGDMIRCGVVNGSRFTACLHHAGGGQNLALTVTQCVQVPTRRCVAQFCLWLPDCVKRSSRKLPPIAQAGASSAAAASGPYLGAAPAQSAAQVRLTSRSPPPTV